MSLNATGNAGAKIKVACMAVPGALSLNGMSGIAKVQEIKRHRKDLTITF